jgi:Fe-S-cluster containining protein
MITISDLNTAVNEATPLLKSLKSLYQRLPETRCQCEQPGVCCAFLPEMTWVEALQWMHTLIDLQEPAKSGMLRKFVEFYLTTPIRRMGCPFLIDGICGIYEYRTFACRAYGLWSHHTGDSRTRENRRSRQALRQSWQQFGVDIPAETMEFEIEYCDKVHRAAGKPISDSQLMDVLQRIYQLDQALPDFQKRFEDEYHSDFSFLIASLALGYRKAILGKFAVIKEIVQQGTDERLQQMLGKIPPDALWES